jgi:hypothetical protein
MKADNENETIETEVSGLFEQYARLHSISHELFTAHVVDDDGEPEYVTVNGTTRTQDDLESLEKMAADLGAVFSVRFEGRDRQTWSARFEVDR